MAPMVSLVMFPVMHVLHEEHEIRICNNVDLVIFACIHFRDFFIL